MIILIPSPRDPCVWDEDVQEFRPDRMLNVRVEKFPVPRRVAVILIRHGQFFAWQEAQVTLVYLIQRFTFSMRDLAYGL
ncbi:uncharacterized protein PHACADRAFT_201137 [Phanerochaete carnosa HHB-10118-sp]|uniref:Uncharacterized protein n=1 Tax=Phanerochaete carnosa (strain HHB-10118-sp) TaxID=650164 RepID=K5VGI5_PHACS|nr:uncharacterized protein PHACADRAFT_201137 [Phanerochaete carnosa HHB-10118-sp]EKM50298.1 hypothetical protein PHACADRAFT_201137 [Phanerochaete carnosa HHB-10118-sp]